MTKSIIKLILLFFFFFVLQKEQSGKEKTTGSTNYNSFPDDIYLDDQDALEGSGRGGGEVRDDLEASGSGLGPDDEDGDDGHGNYLLINLSNFGFNKYPIINLNIKEYLSHAHI